MNQILVCILCCLLLFYSCSEHTESGNLAVVKETEEVIPIEQTKVILPQAGNVALVETYCIACHSLRYIEMQPNMDHKSWEKIVYKMIHTYGAPVPDSQVANDIINYLTAIKYPAGS